MQQSAKNSKCWRTWAVSKLFVKSPSIPRRAVDIKSSPARWTFASNSMPWGSQPSTRAGLWFWAIANGATACAMSLRPQSIARPLISCLLSPRNRDSTSTVWTYLGRSSRPTSTKTNPSTCSSRRDSTLTTRNHSPSGASYAPSTASIVPQKRSSTNSHNFYATKATLNRLTIPVSFSRSTVMADVSTSAST